jgi:oxidase EvaA
VDIKKLDKWVYTNESVMHVENKYFQVIPVEIEIGNREVVSWCQPMIKPMQEGLCAFLCKKINGILHFAVQAKLECGNHDIIEFAPTVQCLTGNYKNTSKGTLPFLEYVLKVKKDLIFYDSLQSEEGGRFYREQNRNLMVLADDTISDELPENFIWMTLNQMSVFLRFNNFFNIQARSLIAAIKFV